MKKVSQSSRKSFRSYRISKKSWRVLRLATVSLWGIFLLGRGNLELANAPTNLSAMQETWGQSLGWKDPLEKDGNALQYSCLENCRRSSDRL